MKIINIKGDVLDKPSLPYISINWHHSLGGVYCHSAELYFNSEKEEQVKLAYVKITLNIVSSLKAKPPTTYDKPVGYFLSYDRDNQLVRIPLHMHDLVKALVCNEWTKKKTGENNKLIAFPTKIEWSLGDENFAFDFDSKTRQTPGMLCADLTKSLAKDEKEQIIICLTREEGRPHNLLDLLK